MHVHSTYSFDGTMSPGQIKELCRKRKTDFVVLTEHADGKHFTPEKMGEMVEECRRLSNDEFLLIPGLEFDCDGMHILAIGVEEYPMESDLEKLIDRIHEKGGLAVLAHVLYYDRIPYEKLLKLDGIEAWNSRYDGRFSPSVKSLRILERFRTYSGGIKVFAGLDLHDKCAFGHITTMAFSDSLTKQNIMASLKDGRFYSTNGFIRLYPINDPSKSKKALFYLIRMPYGAFRKVLGYISRILRKIGVKTPKRISTTIRSFLS